MWRDNLIIHKQASTINQTVGLTSKSKRIIEEEEYSFVCGIEPAAFETKGEISRSVDMENRIWLRDTYHLNNTHKKETMITPL